ncbi:MAG: DNA polymerase ligase N-terminal domain-containing protein, partial [Anaerolineae bacterium]
YDLMLETATLLVTWALSEMPASGKIIPAQQLPDHRRIYLEYEGEISGGRGTVCRWDKGTYLLSKRTSLMLELVLIGDRLRGRAKLFLVDPECQSWRFQYWAEDSPPS